MEIISLRTLKSFIDCLTSNTRELRSVCGAALQTIQIKSYENNKCGARWGQSGMMCVYGDWTLRWREISRTDKSWSINWFHLRGFNRKKGGKKLQRTKWCVAEASLWCWKTIENEATALTAVPQWFVLVLHFHLRYFLLTSDSAFKFESHEYKEFDSDHCILKMCSLPSYSPVWLLPDALWSWVWMVRSGKEGIKSLKVTTVTREHTHAHINNNNNNIRQFKTAPL